MTRKSGGAWSALSLARLVVPVLAVAAGAGSAQAQCSGYTFTTSTGAAIVPGTTDVGNHNDDVTTTFALPFAVSLYGGSYNSATVSSNGNIQFTTGNTQYTNTCLPDSTMGVALMPHWDDLRTDGTGHGIYTSVSGSGSTRIFNIEWRAVYYNDSATALGFEVRLYEDGSRFEFIYGAVPQGGSGATVGAQSATAANQFGCDGGGLSSGLKITFMVANPAVPCAFGPANPATVGQLSSTLLTVSVTGASNPPSTGITVSADLSSILGSANQAFYDDGTHGDSVAGNSIFSFQYTIPAATVIGPKSLPFTAADAQLRSTTGSILLTVTPPCNGPDVTVFNLIDVSRYGQVGNIVAYAVGTDACNPGCLPASWISGNNLHPVVAQNMFRLNAGRFEQIGQSWLKHTFASTNSPGCGSCQQPPNGGAQLGVGCTDAYGSGLNGSQDILGPRSPVNATNGVYPYPFSAPAYAATIGRRLQVLSSDVDLAQFPAARYFVECQYVTQDDAQYNNGLNNATYREVTASTLGMSAPSFAAASHWRSPAIQAWKDIDSTVTLVPADYTDGVITARFWVAAKATDLGNGMWHYEYAVQNLNADRCGGSFSIPVAQGVNVANIGFHGVFAHSGEPFPNTATNLDNWAGVKSSNSVTWTAPEAYVAPGDSANAIRWGTMYNFRFDANVAPAAQNGNATVGLFKPGTPTSATAAGVPVPGAPPGCGPADFNHDTFVTIADIYAMISGWFVHAPQADWIPDGQFLVGDIFAFLPVWFRGCP